MIRVAGRSRSHRLSWLVVLGMVAAIWVLFGIAAAAGEHAAAPERGEATTPGQGEGADQGHGEGHGGGGHTDPVAPVLLALTLILVGAKLGGDLFERFGQPAVLGELIIGLVLGNVGYWFGDELFTILREGPVVIEMAALAEGDLTWVEAARQVFPASMFESPDGPGFHIAALLKTNPYLLDTAKSVDIAARLGVIILLFLVGLESSVNEMLKVGVSAFLVAVVGVIAPFFLGYMVSTFFLPEVSHNVHLFIGATLCATSVGITARVLKDLGKIQTVEAKIILGAAVIDDVLGLIILAVVSGIIQSGELAVGNVVWITAKSLIFLVGAIVLGVWLTPHITRLVSKMRVAGAKLIYVLSLCFILSWLANEIGLATIVGAFAAGLVLTELQFKDFRNEKRRLEELLEPIAAFLVPIFFVLMGVQVKLETFARMDVLLIAVFLTIAAFIGKQICGLAVGRGVDRLTIGVGMVPRGEVGLIFASIGRGLGVVSDAVFSAVVIMVMVTTLVTPPLLKITTNRWSRRQDGIGASVSAGAA